MTNFFFVFRAPLTQISGNILIFSFECLGTELRRLVHHIALMDKDFQQSGCEEHSAEIQELGNSANALIEDFIKQ